MARSFITRDEPVVPAEEQKVTLIVVHFLCDGERILLLGRRKLPEYIQDEKIQIFSHVVSQWIPNLSPS